MVDLYLKSTSLDAFKADLPMFVGEEGELITASHEHALDYVGTVVKTPGQYDADGNEMVAPVFVDGEHFNLRCTEDVAAQVRGMSMVGTVILDPEPATPSRAWA